ncbi:MAG: CPBP family intramembrane metalloprotease [Roseivirga sp.]|nr:CPBP family intramembrane metalloprotease [Roseivirga sp.]
MEKTQFSTRKNVLYLLMPFLGSAVLLPLILQTAENQVIYQSLIWGLNMLMVGWVWYDLRARGQSWKDIGLSFKSGTGPGKLILQSLPVLVITVLAFMLGSVLMVTLGVELEQADLSGYDFLKGNPLMLVLVLLAVYVGSSFSEEAIYRAFLINRIEGLTRGGKKGKHLAIWLSAIVFGLIHFAWGPIGIVQTTFMGLSLGYFYMYFGRNLWVVIIPHMLMDTLLMVQVYLQG